MSFVPHTYPEVHQGAADNAVPASLLSSRTAKPVPTMNRVISLPSTSGSANASGTLTFIIPGGSNSNGFLRAGSLYLRAKITITKAAVANDNVRFANQTNSAASVINRFQLLANGTALETINNYSQYHAIIQSHAMNANYVNNDSSIAEYCGTTIPMNNVVTTDVYVSIPLCSAVFSNVKSFPLFLSGLVLQLDLNTALGAFKVFGANAAAGVTGYSVSNAELVYEIINPDHSMLDAMRQQMAAAGKLFELPMTTVMGLSTSNQAQNSFSYNVGLNLASVSGVLIGEISQVREQLAFGADAGAVQNNFIRNATEDTANNRRFWLDGKQIVNYDVAMDSQNFLETQRALSILLDPACTTLATRGNYCVAGEAAGLYYVSGQNARRFADADLCMCGTPCQNLVIQMYKAGAPVAASVYIYILYDQVVVIDATGSVAVAK
jgi:hypothetical protein